MSLSSLEFVRALADHRVLDSSQMEDLGPYVLQYPDGADLARQLQEWGWLTRYQIDSIFAGKAASLTFGDYRILEPLGQGGMGEVYKAAHVRLNRIVALKMIRPHMLSTSEKPADLIRRFQREAQAASQLIHPNIVILFDFNDLNGIPFLAMEYVDGVDLMKLVRQRGGVLPVSTACDYMRQAALGLEQVFEYGMVHRDIKPSNLLVTNPTQPVSKRGRGPNVRASGLIPRPGVPVPRGSPGGVIKILDLGLVRMSESIDDQSSMTSLTMQGAVIGTPDYISPEQARDATKVDIRADLYSLGCTFYFLLTGQPPFPEGNSVEKLFRHQNDQPRPLEEIRPGIPPEVVGIVQRLLAKKPENRFQTPADLHDAIASLPADLLSGRRAAPATVAAVPVANESIKPSHSPSLATKLFAPDTLILPAKKIGSIAAHRGYVTALAFAPDGRHLASGGVDGSVHMWDVGMARPVERPIHHAIDLGEVHQLSFGPNGKTLYAGSSALDGRRWKWEWTGPQQSIRSRFQTDDYLTNCLAVSPDGQSVVAGSGPVVLVYDANGRKPAHLKGHSGEVRVVAYSPNGKRIYSGGEDKRIVMWEPGRFWNSQKAVFAGHKDSVTAVALLHDGTVMASGAADGAIHLWDAGGDSTEPLVRLDGHTSGVRLLHFVPPGHLLLSIGERGQVCLWEVTEQIRVREWQLEKGMIHAAAVSPDGRYVAIGHGDGCIALYDLEIIGTSAGGQAPTRLLNV